VTAIAAGTAYSCAVVSGEVKCWGDLSAILLAGGSPPLESHEPVAVEGLTTEITAVAVGDGHSCALTDGKVYCWGRNDWGQLGNDDTSSSAMPIAVKGLPDMVTAIAVGYAHSCAIAQGRRLLLGPGLRKS